MRLDTVIEIERAIDTLSPAEMQELYLWLDQHPRPLDARIESDLAAGQLDAVIEQALSDEREGRVQAL